MDNNEPKKYEQDDMEPSMASEPTIAYGYSQGAPLTGLLEYLYATLPPNSMRWLCYSTEQVLQMCKEAQSKKQMA